ncbi:extracellular solute-binding protein [Paenibacillus sp. UNC451MF]|uniref:extracellular solute-binding protein n=1 Tax=Paenibacillus sp. UNC451MF TaxID=1449063 RepID=UPI00048AC23D|nr:extracellular solute-binding protein [Paenibacillus sp. UNC451MF]
MAKKATTTVIVSMFGLAAALTSCSGMNEETSMITTDVNKPLSMLMMWYGNDVLSPVKQQLIQEKVKDKFNVDLKIQNVDKNDYDNEFNTALMNGSNPDIVWMNNVMTRQAAYSGVLLPLDDLVKSSPVWSKMPKEYFADSTYNGKIYSLPQQIQAPESIYYRVDWAEKLNIKPPTNPDELYKMLYAFAKKDPDGDGKANTTGFTMEGNLSRTGAIWRMFLPAAPRKLALYLDSKEDTIKSAYFSSTEMKKALQWLRRGYADGVLDKEWVLEKKKTAEEKFITGKTGAWMMGADMISPRYDKMKASFPNVNITSIPPIIGPHGSNYVVRAGYSSNYVILSKTQDPVAAKKVLDYLLGPEGTMDTRVGIEGQTYRVENSQLQWLIKGEDKYYDPGSILCSVHPLKLPVPIPVLEQNLKAVEGFKMEMNTNTLYIPQSVRASSKAADFEKLALEYIRKIIMGQSPIDQYDEFIGEAKKMGLESILKEINEIYKREKKWAEEK